MAGLPELARNICSATVSFARVRRCPSNTCIIGWGGNFAIADDNIPNFNDADTGDYSKFDDINIVRLGLNVKLGGN